MLHLEANRMDSKRTSMKTRDKHRLQMNPFKQTPELIFYFYSSLIENELQIQSFKTFENIHIGIKLYILYTETWNICSSYLNYTMHTVF